MKNREYLEKYLSDDKLDEGIELLNKGISPQYIVGNVDFYGNIINVDSRVLIPRFETELLVEKTIHYINNLFNKKVSILDIGTGSGCIAITLKKEIDCDVVASDISLDAIDVAKRNAINNNVDILFVNSDIFSNIDNKFDVIISNPPYVKETESVGEETKYEPQNALFAKNNGLYFYEEILKNISKLSTMPKLVAFEIGMNEGEDIKSLALKYLSTKKILIEKDLTNRDRYIFIEFE